MKKQSIVKVKEWFFNKTYAQAREYGMFLDGEYKDGCLRHDMVRVADVLSETEKAYKVMLETTTIGGRFATFTTWMPKSVIEA